MELLGVRVELPANAPIVLLRESVDDRRVLPIYIGTAKAAALAYAHEHVEVPRPMTHDLLRNILEEIGAEPKRIVVTELREHTFYAEIELVVGKTTHRVSSRPSDAIALAARTGTPIFAEERVLAEGRSRPRPPRASLRSSSTSSGSSSSTSAPKTSDSDFGYLYQA